MSTVDLSRNATDFRKHYDGVRMQQGRVLTDDEFNEAAQLTAEDMRRTRLDTIGAYGSPDEGFALKSPTLAGGKPTFTLTAGTLYLGGLRLELAADEVFHLQKDWLSFDGAVNWPGPPVSGNRIDLAWIEVWQQPVTAVEDKELFEVALGGPDTGTRWRTMYRVHVLPDILSDECAAAWQMAAGFWSGEGICAPDQEFATAARLAVSFTVPSETENLCAPPTAGGYLGAENQAIRVQLVDSGHYTWGFDNASPLYRALLSVDNGKRVKLTLLTEPKDAVHWPLKDQVVELLPWGAALANGQRIAELSGHLTKAATSYNPDTAEFTIVDEPPSGFENLWETRADKGEFFDGSAGERYVFVRIWNRGDDLASPAAIPIAQGGIGHTGLSVNFIGGPLRANDYWIIAARPAAPDVVTPWLLESVNGAPPHGVKRYRAPLGLIRWTVSGGTVTGEVIHDCRPPFLPLTKIRNCCSVTVGDGTESFGHFTSIQAAIESLPASSGGTVCILPGIYEESVKLIERTHIVLRGCGPRTRLIAQNDGSGKPLPGILVENSLDITIEALALEAGPLPALWVIDSGRVVLRNSLARMRNEAGNYAAVYLGGRSLEVDHCDILVDSGFKAADFMASVATTGNIARGGIQIAGGAEQVRIAGNRIIGGQGHGITLGSLIRLEIDGDENGQEVPDIDAGTDESCGACAPIDIIIVMVPGRETVRYVSAGDLYDIEIVDNLIALHGGNGISVVRLFGIVNGNLDLIGVHGLTIARNRIERCLQREVAPIADASRFIAAYGGVILALASNLVVEYNAIVGCGLGRRNPVSGLYALFTQGLRIEHNLIADNGPVDNESTEKSQRGLSAGVHVWLAFGGRAEAAIVAAEFSRGKVRGGIGTQLRVHDNVIEQPQGRALFLLGAGPISVANNRLVSYAAGTHPTDVLATTVLVGDLGLSREWTTVLIRVMILLFFGKGNSNSLCRYARMAAGSPLGNRIPSGKLLFTDNQVSFDTLANGRAGPGFDLCSTLLFSLDDLAVLDNQFEYHSEWRFALADVLAAGASIRVNDNRFAEIWGRSLFSAATLGLMNTTSHNQGTHCLLPLGLLTAVQGNLSLVEAFCPDACGRQTESLRGHHERDNRRHHHGPNIHLPVQDR